MRKAASDMMPMGNRERLQLEIAALAARRMAEDYLAVYRRVGAAERPALRIVS